MKKIAYCLIVACAFVFAACGSQETSMAVEESVAPPASNIAENNVQIEEYSTVTLADISFEYNSTYSIEEDSDNVRIIFEGEGAHLLVLYMENPMSDSWEMAQTFVETQLRNFENDSSYTVANSSSTPLIITDDLSGHGVSFILTPVDNPNAARSISLLGFDYGENTYVMMFTNAVGIGNYTSEFSHALETLALH